jgi:hypothetical protein
MTLPRVTIRKPFSQCWASQSAEICEFDQLSALGSPLNCGASAGSHNCEYKTISSSRQSIRGLGRRFRYPIDAVCSTQLGRTRLHHHPSWLLAAVHCTRSLLPFENRKPGSSFKSPAHLFVVHTYAMILSWPSSWPSTGKCCRHSFLSAMAYVYMECYRNRYGAWSVPLRTGAVDSLIRENSWQVLNDMKN